MTRSRLVAVLLTVALLAAGCGGADDDRLVVLVASSLTDVTDALVDAWGGRAVVSEAGSQVLAAQVRGGADADLVLLADPAVAADLMATGLAGAPVELAQNGLAVVVTPALADRVGGPADLAADGLRVVLADEAVPLGDYTRAALGRLEERGLAPPGTRDAVLANAVSLEDAARSVLPKVATGEADAAIVYRTAVRATTRADEVVVRAWPEAADVTAVYTGQLVAGARPGAGDLLAFLGSDEATGVWRSLGFTPR